MWGCLDCAKPYPAGSPLRYLKASDRPDGYYVRFIDADGTDRPYFVETIGEAKAIVKAAL